MQDELMLYSPDNGRPYPYPSHAAQWRRYHGKVAWLFNPWTRAPRHPIDIGSDPFGHAIVAEAARRAGEPSESGR